MPPDPAATRTGETPCAGEAIVSGLGFAEEVRCTPDECLSFLSVHTAGPETAALTQALGRTHPHGPSSTTLTKARLRKAIALLEGADPASPALDTWRDVESWHWSSPTHATVVLDPDPHAPTDHPDVLALRALAASGRHLVPEGSATLLTTKHPLLARWQERWPTLPGQYGRWRHALRLWSIPGGAYPDTDAEYAAVLDDHVSLLRDLLDGQPLLAVVVDLSPSPHPPASLTDDDTIPGLTPFATWAWTESPPHLLFAHAAVAEVALDAQALAPLIGAPEQLSTTAALAVAVILTSADLRFQYRPYEAGVDILLPDHDAVTALARAHSARLPWGDELGDRAAHLLAATRAVLASATLNSPEDVAALEQHCRRERVAFATLDPDGDRADALRRALAEVRMNPEEAVVVTGSVADVVASRSAGARTIGCADDEAGRRALTEAGADAVVARIVDVLPLP